MLSKVQVKQSRRETSGRNVDAALDRFRSKIRRASRFLVIHLMRRNYIRNRV